MGVSDTSLVERQEMLEALANQRRRMGAENDELAAELERVRVVAKEEIERLTRELADWKQAASVEAGLRREFYDRALTAEAQRDGAYEAIDQFFVGWDSMPVGDHSVLTISRWLNSKSMVDGVSAIRAARLKPDQEETPLTKPKSSQSI